MNAFDRIDSNRKTIAAANLFDGDMRVQIRNYYRVSLTSSCALDCNSLTDMETKILLEDSITPHGRLLRHMFEIIGHADACNLMFTLTGKRGITEQDILTMHRQIYKRGDSDSKKLTMPGEYRYGWVHICGSRYPAASPWDIQNRMDEMLEWADTMRGGYHPVEYAARIHKRLLFILPLRDGNGLVARLLMNTALLQDGYLPAIITPALRSKYNGLLEYAHTDDRPFIDFIAECALEGQERMMAMLHIGPERERGLEPEPAIR